MKKIQFTSGCPNNCKYCYEPKEVKKLSFNYQDLFLHNEFQILDMNFLANPDHIEILNKIPKRKYELVCGVDYRRLTQEICDLMKNKGFIKIRWAWDHNFGMQRTHKKIWQMWLKAGYKPKDLSVFILVNWKIPFVDCVKKIDLLKVWNVKVNDCCWDGGYKIAKAKYWTPDQIKRFRAMCRKHNQLINFKIDPEFK
jgi:hypothetical protein